MKTAVYIGAGLDVKPIEYMKSLDIDRFIYIDSMPATYQPDWNNELKYTQYDPKFIKKFCTKIRRIGFKKINNIIVNDNKNIYEPASMTFMNSDTKVSVIYYFNTQFPTGMTTELIKQLKDSNILIDAGYHPPKSILDYMKKPIHLICFKGTVYEYDEYDEYDENDSLINYIHKNMDSITDISYYFDKSNFKRLKHITDIYETM